MRQKKLAVFVLAAALSCTSFAEKIDRKAVVSRHNLELSQVREASPAQVGNGEFAYNFDITGMQTFIPFNTMAHWGWHCEPMPEGMKSAADFKGMVIPTNGRDVVYEVDNESLEHYSESYKKNPFSIQSKEQKAMARWLAGNPHAMNLGRIGFEIKKSDGTFAKLDDIKDAVQKTDLWTGIVKSEFSLEGKKTSVVTVCRQDSDTLAFSVESPLLKEGRLRVFFEFPYCPSVKGETFVGKWDMPSRHISAMKKSANTASIQRTLDDAKYFLEINWETSASFDADKNNPHKFFIAPKESSLKFSCNFSQEKLSGKSARLPNFKNSLAESAAAWEKFWLSGAAIDLSGSTDKRWKELERRIILSQYAMRLNEAGSLPPQESGLINNTWFGRFHYEMLWWHTVHFALWGRPEIAHRQLEIYKKYLPDAIARAKKEGYKGARWPKCTADSFQDWPHIIHSSLVWQQPHPIYFAEMFYRINPSKEVLNEWKDVVFQTAEFLADLPARDANGIYNLVPPLSVVSENTDPLTTRNPTFELSYFRYGLRTALEWQKRLGLKPNAKWREVCDNLAPLPEQDGLYVLCEGIGDMWSKYNYEHPALIGVYGMLPGDGVNKSVFKNTLKKVYDTWRMRRIWGWDFPMLAMASLRTGDREKAMDTLMTPLDSFKFDEHGLVSFRKTQFYFPANGGFLAAIAMMCGGWDGADSDAFDKKNLAFPKNGKWEIKVEGFNKFQ